MPAPGLWPGNHWTFQKVTLSWWSSRGEAEGAGAAAGFERDEINTGMGAVATAVGMTGPCARKAGTRPAAFTAIQTQTGTVQNLKTGQSLARFVFPWRENFAIL